MLSFPSPLLRCSVLHSPSRSSLPSCSFKVGPLVRRAQISQRRNHSSAKHPPFNIHFFGSDEFSVEVLKSVMDAKELWKSLKVVTTGDKDQQRTPDLYIPPLLTFADLHKIERLVVAPTPLSSSGTKSSATESTEAVFSVPDTVLGTGETSSENLLVVASYGQILPPSLLNLFAPNRRLNVHPSLLPHLRGPSPIQTAIYNGETETGVSIIGVEQKVDTGDIWAQDRCGLYKNDTFAKMKIKLGVLGGRLLVDVMRKMLMDQAESRPQGEGATYCRKVNDTWSGVVWEECTADKLSRIWRAIGHAHPPKAIFFSKAKIWKTFRMLDVEETRPSKHTRELLQPGWSTYVDKTQQMHVRCAGGTEATFKYAHTEGSQKTGSKQWRNGLPKRIMEFGRGDKSKAPYLPSPWADAVHPHRAGPSILSYERTPPGA
ncbi:Formyltransferase [Calocera cornea HHB12733]|uniref:methionyl-tRNA formyltransferase n=1 Tax=Calocera cornea HHB12733 TaxID=1353952 RepID=A0A165JZH2_9BASI|nr:Formyltransferase [Calocera cornea HHB12733]